MKRILWDAMAFCLCMGMTFTSCSDDNENATTIVEVGNYNSSFVNQLMGFEEEKGALLAACNTSEQEFIRLSTDSAWALPTSDQQTLQAIRNGVSRPDGKTLLQKIIPLNDITTYMDNIYGGTIGGFVCEAADVKSLHTMHDVFHGLRLDYEGTKFKADGAGYAVIRFYSSVTDRLAIPYSPELGGTQQHAWPNGGGGFTTSTLGKGGYPEWTFDGYYSPEENAELYEVTPGGFEILRSVYSGGKWKTYEPGTSKLTTRSAKEEGTTTLRNGRYAEGVVQTLGDYKGHTFHIRAVHDGKYWLSTNKHIDIEGLETLEKGVYGLGVDTNEVKNVREIVF